MPSPPFLSSGRIGKVELRNRLIRTATSETMCTVEGEVTDDLIKLYDDLAKGGAGLLITGNIELIDDWDGVGQRLTATGTSHFLNVAVTHEEIIFDAPGLGYGIPYSNTFAQLFLTAVNAGIARAVVNEVKALVRSRKRTFYFAPGQTPATDPILQQTVGQISCGAFAAESVVLAAATALDEATIAAETGHQDAAALTIEAALAAAKAKVVTDEFAISNGSLLFDVGSASSTKRSANLDRHWRNARTFPRTTRRPTKLWLSAITRSRAVHRRQKDSSETGGYS